MLKVLILVCASSLSHDACTVATADSVLRGPRHVSVFACGFYGQALPAGSAGLVDPARQYTKIVCAADQVAEAGK